MTGAEGSDMREAGKEAPQFNLVIDEVPPEQAWPIFALNHGNVMEAARLGLPSASRCRPVARRVALFLLFLGGLSLAAWRPLQSFDLLMLKDAGSQRVVEGVAYAAGPRQRLDVYAPVTRQKGPQPVVVFFYGGAWSSGRRQDYAFVGRALAAEGFVVVVPDYRLLPEVHFPTFLEDSAAAVRWARDNAAAFGGDEERITLVGHSAGAYNAAMLALDPQWLGPERAAVRGLVTLSGPFDFLPLDDPATIAAFGTWSRPEETQPIFHASADDPPALLLHGAADDRIQLRHSEALEARLDAVGGRPELIVYPDLGHVGVLTALARPLRIRAPVLEDIAAFVKARRS